MATREEEAAKRADNAIQYNLRMSQAIELRLAGATYRIIAEKAGFSSPIRAANAMREYMQKLPLENGDELRWKWLARIERGVMAIWPKYVKGESQAIASMVRLASVAANIGGFGAKKLELSGPEGRAIQFEGGVTLKDLDDARAAAEANRRAARTIRPPAPLDNGTEVVTSAEPIVTDAYVSQAPVPLEQVAKLEETVLDAVAQMVEEEDDASEHDPAGW